MHAGRLLPPDPTVRAVAQRLYAAVKDLPIISPHGHTDPAWFARNTPFSDPVSLLVAPDHYIFRMLYSAGVPLERLGIASVDGRGRAAPETDPRAAWRVFAEHWYLFRGTPTRLWMDHVLYEVFGVGQKLGPETADAVYDHIDACLRRDDYRPRALFERFGIEVLSTTDSAHEPLAEHEALRGSGWRGRVIPAFRPDAVVDPEHERFRDALAELSELTGLDCFGYRGYIAALEKRRVAFKALGATSTDHGHPTAHTASLGAEEAQRLFAQVTSGDVAPADAERFRGHMLVEMARMSIDDGLVMQLHPGSFRNHNRDLFARFGRDKGADIPQATEYVRALKPLLDRFGNDPRLSLIVFTLDESAYSRELAPLAGHYPALKLGPAWWFHDSPEGMRRYRERVTETAGFYNTVGFNDDTRAFFSIPARHDVARRVDCAYLAQLVCDHRLPEDEAHEVAHDLAYRLVKKAYKL
jgi:glucuronate isomerase